MNKTLDIHQRKERFKNWKIAAAIIALFLAVGYMFLPPLGQSSTVFGEVTDWKVREGDGAQLYLVVRLDSNMEVLVKIRRFSENFKKRRKSKIT